MRLSGSWEFAGSGPQLSGPASIAHFISAAWDGKTLTLRRDPSGGERLYYRLDGRGLRWSSSLKDLLGPRPIWDAETAAERGLAELVLFGDRTLVEGVREVLPGYEASFTAEGPRPPRWAWGGLLGGEPGAAEELAPRFRSLLKEAVAGAIAGESEAAVSLSGGVDSAAIAALAAELLGPERVHAFTYVFEDPGHPSEEGHAAEVCRHLGIRSHTVVRISLDDYLAAVPECVWRAEDPGFWKRPYVPILSRAIAGRGFSRFLTGFGVGSHMGALEELAASPVDVEAWEGRRPSHPGEATAGVPFYRLQYPVAAALGAAHALPAELRETARRLFASARVQEELAAHARLPLGRRLQTLAFLHMNSCADVARGERLARETGCLWLSPAHAPSCIPLAYFPVSGGRSERPGKRLLKLAFKDTLPESVLSRRKHWAHPIGSRAWRDAALEKMRSASGEAGREAVSSLYGGAYAAAERFCPEGVIPLAFWRLLLLERRFDEPPTWEALLDAGVSRA